MGVRDDLKCSMNRVDKSLLSFADYFKVFGNVRLTTALRKMHRLLCFFFFSRKLVKWMITYLSERRHFLQIDDKCSDVARVPIEVPQRSILGHVIFNLNVADLQDVFRCKSFQNADDTTLFSRAEVCDLSGEIDDENVRLDRLGTYSSESNLAVNSAKTKLMRVPTPQMCSLHEK